MATIRALRLQRGWSQVELARRSRVHPSDLSKIEGGRIRPYQPQLRRLARALGVSAKQLTSETRAAVRELVRS